MPLRVQNPDGPQSKRSERFYFEDLFIRAEDTLFKVHRKDFEHGSEVFNNMFELPKASGKADGSSEEQPLVLEGIKACELEDFLSVLYPRVSTDAEPESLSLERWKAVYNLATMWEFAGVRDEALRVLKAQTRAMSSIDTVVLYRELDLEIDADFVLAVQRLVEREQEISHDEGARLGLWNAMRVCTVRGWYSGTHARAQLPSKICAVWDVPLVPGLPSAPEMLLHRRKNRGIY